MSNIRSANPKRRATLLLCEQFDVIILQELWLPNYVISLLRSNIKNLKYMLSVLWMTNSVYMLDVRLVVLVCYGDNIFHMLVQFVIYKMITFLGFDIDTNDGILFILNVYLPY